jgi:CubicO group peptidase (beta-lactamase class C family)
MSRLVALAGSSLVSLALAYAPLGAQTQASAALLRRVDSVFTAYSYTSTPGCAVGVDRGGAPLLRRAYGMADLEAGTPWRVGTISESGSVAKQFTAAALVILARDGVLSLDDDITKWVPEARGFGKRITIRQVLSHTSGIPDRYYLHEMEGRPAGEVNHPNAEVLDIVSRLRDLNFDPGDDYLYSNTGYVIAVAVAERASGKSLQQLTEERIFRPLGMQSRWRTDHRTVVPGRAPAYTGTVASGFRHDHPFTRVYGAGGLLVTVDDFLKWTDALMRGDGDWGAVRDSLQAVIRLNDGTAITYGLGVTTDEWRGVQRMSHTGSTGGYRAALASFPQQRVSVALLCNVGSANPGGLAAAVSAIVLGDALAPVVAEVAPAIAVPPEELRANAGAYRSPRTEEVMRLVVRDGQLVDSLGGAVFIPLGGDRFRQRGSQRTLAFSGGGESRRVRVEMPNARPVEYERVPLPIPGAAAMAAFAGRYRSPELGSEYTLQARGDSLFLSLGWRGEARLLPLYQDGFSTGGGEYLRFTRDRRGRVTGFVVWAGRVRHLRFERVTGT